MSEWREDPRLNRRVRIAPDRARRPNDFSGGGSPKRCPFCAGSEEDTPEELDRIVGADGQWLARTVSNLYPAFEGEDGAHEVVIESPRHVSRFVDLPLEEATAAVTMWSRRVAHWRKDPRFDYQLVFKNEGRAAGASLEHVHSQVVALVDAPSSVSMPTSALPLDELRVVTQAKGLRAYCPPAPRFTFETWIEPVDDDTDFASITATDAEDVARLLQDLLSRILQAGPADSFNLLVAAGVESPWRIEITPRAAVLAGFELATNLWINPVAPELAAARLRDASSE